MRWWTCSVLLAATLLAAARAGNESLDVLPYAQEQAPASQVGEGWLQAQIAAALKRREETIAGLVTPEQVREHQQRVRSLLRTRLLLPGNPGRPRARVTGRLRREGFRVEKLLIESHPGFHITAVLYLPETKRPFPAVLVPCGHSENGKAAEAYQRACIVLAKAGLAALCFDPIGQGERKQVLDASGRPLHRATAEHSLLAPGSIAAGSHLAAMMVWDGMRCIDYLQSRGDIDPKRIGCAGNSGGGTQTSYLMAVDDRIAAAAPNCYLTSFRRLLATIGPQDAEQNLQAQIGDGLDHADFILARAPQATLIGAATRDFFDIDGTWSTFREAKRLFTRLGFPERVDLVEADAEHGFSTRLRTATAQFMLRWLAGREESVTEEDFPVFTDAELQCTPDGQVLRMKGERDYFAVTRSLLMPPPADGAPRTVPETSVARLRSALGLSSEPPLPAAASVVDTIARGPIRVRKLLLKVGGRCVPALGYEPDRRAGEAILYLSPGGKAADAAPDGPIEQLARQGHPVLTVDLTGFGELQARDCEGKPVAGSGRLSALAYLYGRSLLSLRVEEILGCLALLAQQDDGRRAIRVVARGEAGPPALHAAVLEPDRVGRLELTGSLRSWADLLRGPGASAAAASVVPGALRYYDLPDLVHVLGPRVTVSAPVDGQGRPAPLAASASRPRLAAATR